VSANLVIPPPPPRVRAPKALAKLGLFFVSRTGHSTGLVGCLARRLLPPVGRASAPMIANHRGQNVGTGTSSGHVDRPHTVGMLPSVTPSYLDHLP
jgi:hypothetical protein